MIFTVAEIRAIRQGHQQAKLVLVSEKITPGRTRTLRRIVPQHNEDGKVMGHRREPVTETRKDGSQRQLVLTVLAVEEVAVADLDHKIAKACGHRTSDELRQAWRAAHSADRAQLVYFAIGDLRDEDRYIGWTGRGGDYTPNPLRSSAPEAPALSVEQLDHIAALNAQTMAKQRADEAKRLSGTSAARRLARIETAGERIAAEVRRELRVITERIERAEKRHAA